MTPHSEDEVNEINPVEWKTYPLPAAEIPVDPLWERRQDLNQAMTIVDATKYLKTNLPLYRMALAVAAEKAKELVTVLQKAEADAMENPGGR